MSKLVHMCTGCGHQDAHHDKFRAAFITCPCCRQQTAPEQFEPEPILVETFTHPGSKPEPLYKPGMRRNAGTGHAETLCGCERCRAIYDAQVGA